MDAHETDARAGGAAGGVDAAEALRLAAAGEVVLVDVRREPARRESGRAIRGAERREPETLHGGEAGDYVGRRVLVFCVHGHEVSQNAAAALRDGHADVDFITGGFEALVAAGAETEPLPESGAAPASARPGGLNAGLWTKIGLLSFGGPAGQIALMQSEIVDRRGLVDQQTFMRGLNFSMLLPGPEAQQLATWLGWRTGGVWAGVFAGLAFILPGAALMILLTWAAARYGETEIARTLFAGVQPVVLVIIAQALWKIASRSLSGAPQVAVAALAFVGLAFLGAPFPLIVALAAIAGLLLPYDAAAHSAPSAPAPAWSGRFALTVVAASVAIVVAVFFGIRAAFGPEPFDDVAALFTTAAFVTFGGAYAVLPFVADQAVETYGWLTRAEMLNGLAMAETTPGPLILVNVYAGFFAGWGAPGDAGAAALTAALACFYTFAPSFMLILASAPYVERLQDTPLARRALAGVSAAVVGVIANLGVYLGVAALAPEGASGPFGVDLVRIAITVVAALLAFGAKVSILWLIAFGAAAGLGLGAAGLL